MKQLLIAFAIVLLAIPIAAVATFFLIPFWNWLEAQTGLESIGHSGPSEWCFVLVYTLTLLGGLGAWLWMRSRSKR